MIKRKIILVITKTFDPHVDLVLSYLESKIVRIDIEDVINGTSGFLFREDGFIIKNKFIEINIDDIDVVYWRKPLVNPLDIPDSSEKIVTIWGFFLDNLAALLNNKKWINHPQKYWLASKKIFQLHLALEIGLKVPSFIFSNKPYLSFDLLSENKLLYKSIVTQHSVQGVSLESNYGNVLLSKEDVDKKDILPSLLQKFINRKAEWRVTIIGQKVFSAKLLPDGNYIDIKEVDNYKVLPQKLDKSIEKSLKLFMIETGLDYCAFDLIEDFSGDIYFLEANPNGQWLWIESKTKLPISSAIAEYLEN